jgi:hypothetical protein
MGDRHWVRHASLSGFVGPLSLAELRAAHLAGSVPPEAQVRLAAPDGRAEVLDDRGWTPIHQVLGVAPPLPVEPTIPLPLPGVPGVRPEQVLSDVRDRSSYAMARSLASLLAVVALMAIGIVVVLGLVAAVHAKDWWLALAAIADGGLQGASVVVAYQAFAMLADIADCHLRRETERAARTVAAARDA